MAETKKKFKMILLRNLAGVLAIVWMCIIFAFSAQPKEESGEMSAGFTYQMVSSTNFFFHLDLSDARVKEIADAIEGFVRKVAHMAEFGLLSVLLYIWIGQWEMGFLRKGATAAGAAAVYAATDEIHQLFVAGRAGRFTDVLIDSAGAVLGVVVFALVVKIVGVVKARKAKKQEKLARQQEKQRKRQEEREKARQEREQEKSGQQDEAEQKSKEPVQQSGETDAPEGS
ncbi:MAG: VanZ family protein [Bacteroidales bacterium]|nr:VanZ family protein [Bacteroidales bacterium]MCM1414780.1 VanZ family protein [bacterium]MCM1423214.1 VanZ family protein [bacterium]